MASNGTRAFAVGAGGLVVRGDATGWSVEPTTFDDALYGVATRGDDVLAVGGTLRIGEYSLIAHRRGGQWHTEASQVQDILLDACWSPYGWIAVGFNGAVVRGAPGSWIPTPPPHYSHLFGVACVAETVFAVGLAGTIWEFDGRKWTLHNSGVDEHLRAVVGTDRERVIAVGSSGTALRFDGTSWRRLDIPTTKSLDAVQIGPDGTGYAAGERGLVMRFADDEWSEVDIAVDSSLHAVCRLGARTYVAGADATLLALP